MTHTVSLTDGTTTIPLTSSGVLMTAYPMDAPDMRQNESLLGTDGGSLSRPQWQNVTESIDILLTGTTAAIRAKANDIERMLHKARESRRVMSLARVYVQAQVAGESEVWRSEILSGRLVWDEPLDGVVKLNAQATLIITRRYYWEGAEVALQMTSAATGTATTSPVTFVNDHDATTNNYIHIAAGQATGQVPAPIKLKLTNTSGSNVGVENVYISNTTHVGTVSLFRRGTQADGGATFSSGSSNNLLAYRWVLTDTQLAALNGRYARILVAFNGSYNGYIQAGLRVFTSSDLYRIEQVKGTGFHMLDLGAIPITPFANIPDPTGISLVLFLQQAGGVSTDLRYIQMTPAGEGIFRRLYYVGTLPNNESIVDDGIEGIVYELDTGNKARPTIYPFGSPIHIWPGQSNRIRILYHTATGLGAGNTMTAQAWFRPRRLTI